MKAPTIYKALGNLPQTRVTMYSDQKVKPTVSPPDGWRVAFLRYKTEDSKTETPKLRQNMAVQCHKLQRQRFSGEFYDMVLSDLQDEAMKRVADGEITLENAESEEFIQSDYMDTSRIGGKRVKEADVTAWFTANMADWLANRIAAKYDKWTEDKVSALTGQYQKSFGELAKSSLPQSFGTAKNMLVLWTAFIQETEIESDGMLDYITARIEKLMTRHQQAEDLEAAV